MWNRGDAYTLVMVKAGFMTKNVGVRLGLWFWYDLGDFSRPKRCSHVFGTIPGTFLDRRTLAFHFGHS